MDQTGAKLVKEEFIRVWMGGYSESYRLDLPTARKLLEDLEKAISEAEGPVMP